MNGGKFRGKALMLGNASVGKTSLLARYIDDKFYEEYSQTIGANFTIKEIDLRGLVDKKEIINNNHLKDDIELKLFFWDIGGQTDKLFVTEYYFIQAVGALVVYDILNRESFENLNFWISKLTELSGDVPFIIIGNKIDEKNRRSVSFEEGKEKAEEFKVDYIETSAKTNENVNKAFDMLAIKILSHFG